MRLGPDELCIDQFDKLQAYGNQTQGTQEMPFIFFKQRAMSSLESLAAAVHGGRKYLGNERKNDSNQYTFRNHDTAEELLALKCLL